MSISPTHWMPIRGPRYSEITPADDISSLDSQAHAQPQRHRHRSSHHRRSRSRSNNSHRSSHHTTHISAAQHSSYLHYNAPNHAGRRAAPPPPPPRILYQPPEQEGEEPNHHSQLPHTLQLHWGSSQNHDGSGEARPGLILDSASKSRSGFVSSRLSSSVCSSDDSLSAACSSNDVRGNALHVRPQHTATRVLHPPRSSSEVLAELALKGSGVTPWRVDDDEWGREEVERVERPNTLTVSCISPFPLPPPPPPPLPPRSMPAQTVFPLSASSSDSSNSGRRPAHHAADFHDGTPSAAAESVSGTQAKKPQPRVTATVPPPCPALFQHMEGSPHGIQMLSAQSPRLARRRDSQPTTAQPPPPPPPPPPPTFPLLLLSPPSSSSLSQPPHVSMPDGHGGDQNRAASGGSSSSGNDVDDAALMPRSETAGSKADAFGCPPLSPAGSSNGLSARTPGVPPSSSSAAVSCLAGSIPTTEHPSMATPKMSYQAASPAFASEGGQSQLPPSLSVGRSPRSAQMLTPLLPTRTSGSSGNGAGYVTPHMTMSTLESCRDALSLSPLPAARAVKLGGAPLPRFSIPTESGSSNATSGATLKVRPPSLNLTSPRPASGRRLSSSYMSPLTDYHPEEGGSMLRGLLPATPLGPRGSSSTTPLVPPLDFTGISDGPLVRDGEVVSAGSWCRSTDGTSRMLSPCVMASSYVCSGYDEDDDESEDEFADYRPRWRKEEERRQMEQQQREEQDQHGSLGCGARGAEREEEEVSSNDDYIVPGYSDAAAAGNNPAFPSFHLSNKQGTRATQRNFPSRAAAAYASRSMRKDLSRSFLRSGASHRNSRVGSSATSWAESIKRFLSVAGTWLTRFLAIYISSLLILKTRSMI